MVVFRVERVWGEEPFPGLLWVESVVWFPSLPASPVGPLFGKSLTVWVLAQGVKFSRSRVNKIRLKKVPKNIMDHGVRYL